MITTAYFHSTEDSTWIAILDDGREIKFLADGEPAEALAQQLGGRQISPSLRRFMRMASTGSQPPTTPSNR